MVRNFQPGNPGFDNQVNALKGFFHGGSPMASFGSGSGAGGVSTAQAFLYNQLHRQATMLSYLDIIVFMGGFTAIMVPLVFFVGKIKPAGDAPVH